jgi:hypothetical protein
VESRRIKGKVVQRFIRYVGKQADGKTVLSTSISDVDVSEVRLCGPLLVLHHLAQEIGLPELDELNTMYKVYLRDAKRGFQISRVVAHVMLPIEPGLTRVPTSS